MGIVRAFLRRFIILGSSALFLGGVVLALFAGFGTAAAFCLAFLLVGADFLWIAHGVRKAMKDDLPGVRGTAALAFGLSFRTLLLIAGLYGIIALLPGKSLGVILGIGGPLVILAVSGTVKVGG